MSHIKQLIPMIPVLNPKPNRIRIVEPTSPNLRLKGILKPADFRVTSHINLNPILNEKQLPLVIINISVQELPSQTYDASSENHETHSSTPGKKSGEGVTFENDLQLGLCDVTQLHSHINQHRMHGAATNSSVQLDGIVSKLPVADIVNQDKPPHVVSEVSGTATNTTKHSKIAFPAKDASTGKGGDMQVVVAHGEIQQGMENEIQHVRDDEQEFEVQLDALPTVAVEKKQQDSHKQLVLQKNAANQPSNSFFFNLQNLEISISSQFQGLE
ncbi:hypothetical protein K7X08_034110 [Anisodus acutangulus]|uniref:Uncharacterized protein n=1 Tax=Anisodus acutangulus TaxID=402998 RepID=A0A9Q1R9X0_9SOLA|nr:hypothetical protein K7X08_034110 [Anisodus acutangulus]